MSQAKTKYLVHPLLGKPENCLPREIYSAFLAAQVEIYLVCKYLDNIKLTMDDRQTVTTSALVLTSVAQTNYVALTGEGVGT